MIELKQYSVFCEQGVRGNNEDFIYPATAGKNDRIFVLCDGMGGHGHGEVASETVGMAVYRFLEVQHADVFTPMCLRRKCSVKRSTLPLRSWKRLTVLMTTNDACCGGVE